MIAPLWDNGKSVAEEMTFHDGNRVWLFVSVYGVDVGGLFKWPKWPYTLFIQRSKRYAVCWFRAIPIQIICLKYIHSSWFLCDFFFALSIRYILQWTSLKLIEIWMSNNKKTHTNLEYNEVNKEATTKAMSCWCSNTIHIWLALRCNYCISLFLLSCLSYRKRPTEWKKKEFGGDVTLHFVYINSDVSRWFALWLWWTLVTITTRQPFLITSMCSHLVDCFHF